MDPATRIAELREQIRHHEEQYYVHALRIWYLALDQARELEQAVLDHREILEAIRAGDANRAEGAMRRHVNEFEETMRRVLIGS